jgi:hypothetical protein
VPTRAPPLMRAELTRLVGWLVVGWLVVGGWVVGWLGGWSVVAVRRPAGCAARSVAGLPTNMPVCLPAYPPASDSNCSPTPTALDPFWVPTPYQPPPPQVLRVRRRSRRHLPGIAFNYIAFHTISLRFYLFCHNIFLSLYF